MCQAASASASGFGVHLLLICSPSPHPSPPASGPAAESGSCSRAAAAGKTRRHRVHKHAPDGTPPQGQLGTSVRQRRGCGHRGDALRRDGFLCLATLRRDGFAYYEQVNGDRPRHRRDRPARVQRRPTACPFSSLIATMAHSLHEAAKRSARRAGLRQPLDRRRAGETLTGRCASSTPRVRSLPPTTTACRRSNESICFFNTSGPVVAADHYCVPPLERIDLSDILSLIGTKRYFVLHAPRQTGKTSALLALRDLLNGGSPRQVPLRLRKRRGRPGGTRRPSGSDARHPQRTGSRVRRLRGH